MDEQVTIQISDLDPGQPVTMATKLDEGGDTYVAHAFYAADDDGRVDLTHSTSTGGSYVGEFPFGQWPWNPMMPISLRRILPEQLCWYPVMLWLV